jgi:hypothetical protein
MLYIAFHHTFASIRIPIIPPGMYLHPADVEGSGGSSSGSSSGSDGQHSNPSIANLRNKVQKKAQQQSGRQLVARGEEEGEWQTTYEAK